MGRSPEANEVIGGFALSNAKDRAEAVEYAQRSGDLFEEVEVEVEVRQAVEFDDLAAPGCLCARTCNREALRRRLLDRSVRRG